MWEKKLEDSGAVVKYDTISTSAASVSGVQKSEEEEDTDNQEGFYNVSNASYYNNIPSNVHLNDMQNTFLNFHQASATGHPSIVVKNEEFGRPSEYMEPVQNSYNPSLHAQNIDWRQQKMKLESSAQEIIRQRRPRSEFEDERQRNVKKPRFDDIHQFDGVDDEESDNLDSNDEDEDSLNSDDDIIEEITYISNILLAQYEKVKRTKNKWKCLLKYGIMNLDGKDFLFHSATGDFVWT
jgi:hypothetical protein